MVQWEFPVPAAPACPGVKGRALIEPPRQSQDWPTVGAWLPRPPRPFCSFRRRNLDPGSPPHTSRSWARPAGFVSLAEWGRPRYRELERFRRVGGWAIQSLLPFSSWRLSSGAWGCSRPGCRGGRGGEGPEDRCQDAAGETTWHSGAREPACPDCPLPASASGWLSPEGTVSEAPGGPLGLQVEDVGLSVGTAAGSRQSPWGTFC